MTSFFETMQAHWINAKRVWSGRDYTEAVRQELAQAELERLAAQSHKEYYEALVAFNDKRIERLRAIKDEDHNAERDRRALRPLAVGEKPSWG